MFGVSVQNFLKGLRPTVIDRAVFFATGAMWKRIRNMMTPAFSTSKLKLVGMFLGFQHVKT
jgi:cytochrome P450